MTDELYSIMYEIIESWPAELIRIVCSYCDNMMPTYLKRNFSMVSTKPYRRDDNTWVVGIDSSVHVFDNDGTPIQEIDCKTPDKISGISVGNKKIFAYTDSGDSKIITTDGKNYNIRSINSGVGNITNAMFLNNGLLICGSKKHYVELSNGHTSDFAHNGKSQIQPNNDSDDIIVAYPHDITIYRNTLPYGYIDLPDVHTLIRNSEKTFLCFSDTHIILIDSQNYSEIVRSKLDHSFPKKFKDFICIHDIVYILDLNNCLYCVNYNNINTPIFRFIDNEMRCICAYDEYCVAVSSYNNTIRFYKDMRPVDTYYLRFSVCTHNVNSLLQIGRNLLYHDGISSYIFTPRV